MEAEAPVAAGEPPAASPAEAAHAEAAPQAFVFKSTAWADEEEEDEEMTSERALMLEEQQKRFRSRRRVAPHRLAAAPLSLTFLTHGSERFGGETEKEASRRLPALDKALGSGGGGSRGREAKPRLSRLELMEQRRLASKRTGFATGFDLLTAEEAARREDRRRRYGDSLLGVAKDDVPSAAAALQAAHAFAAQRVQRVQKFGAQALDPAARGGDVLEPRRDALGDAIARPDCVHVYGVDVMSNSDCLTYFRDYSPVFVEWINGAYIAFFTRALTPLPDSSCNVVFEDAYTAARAMFGSGVLEVPLPPPTEDAMASDAPPPPAPPTEAEAEPMAVGEAAADGPSAPAACPWFKGADFVTREGGRVPLSFRMATTDDVKPDGVTQSRYLWCGGEPPAPPPRRGGRAAGGGKRKRGRGREDGEVEEAPAPTEDLREALKRRRAEADAVPQAMEAGEAAPTAEADVAAQEGGGAGDAMATDGLAAAPAPVKEEEEEALAPPQPDAPLPAGDLRGLVSPGVPDFGNDQE